MPDEVETTAPADGAPPASAPPPVPATTPPPAETDALVKAAEEKVRRELQAIKDREVARLHQQYQQRERALKSEAAARLKQAGDEGAGDWEKNLEVRQKADAFDALTAEQQQWQAWWGHVADVATSYGLQPTDTRLTGAQSSQELHNLAKQALAEDVKKERARLLAEAEDKRRAAADGVVASGALDTLSGAPAPVVKETTEQLTARLADLQKKPVENRKLIAEVAKKLEAQVRR